MKSSPWGHVQDCTIIAPDIMRVSTASHGGYHCTGNAQERIETLFPTFTPWAGRGWYEEDCDWAMVALAHPQHFDDRAVYHALQTVGNSHASSDYFTAAQSWLGNNGEEARAVRNTAEQYAKTHALEYEISSLGSAPSSAPRGAWSVSFYRLIDGATRREVLAEYPRQAVFTEADIDRLAIHTATTEEP